MTQFQVDVDQLRGHADTVGTIAGGLHDAAGTSQNLDGMSLGIFVGFLTEALATAATRTIGAIGTAASTMDSVRTGLTGVADGYQGTDTTNATDLQGIEDAL
jgi:hypothetical protein